MSKKIDGITMPPTIGETLLSFGCTLVFSILSLAPFLKLKDVIPLALRVVLPAKYATQMYTIITAVVLGIIWIVLFFVLWHKLERCDGNRPRIFKTLKWCGFAALVYLLMTLAHTLLDKYVFSGIV